MNKIMLDDIKIVAESMEEEMIKGKTFLISGACGFIARYFAYSLLYLNQNVLEKKCKIIALCRSYNKASDLYKDFLDDPNFILCIQDAKEELGLDQKVDYIIHAASMSATKTFGENPVGILDANVLGTYQLLEFARKVHVKGFLFLSSGAVYGNIPPSVENIAENDHFPIDAFKIENCYSIGKKMGEHWCYVYYRQYETPTKIVRLGHTYGPGIDLTDGHVYSDFVKCILNNENLILKSDGEDERPFCYITDVIKGCFLILFHGRDGEAYNLTNENCLVSIKNLAQILCNQFGNNLRNEPPCQTKRVLKPSKKIHVNNEKINTLGWKPDIGIVEGFVRTINSFKAEVKV